jgi:hypothetical protein
MPQLLTTPSRRILGGPAVTHTERPDLRLNRSLKLVVPAFAGTTF